MDKQFYRNITSSSFSKKNDWDSNQKENNIRSSNINYKKDNEKIFSFQRRQLKDLSQQNQTECMIQIKDILKEYAFLKKSLDQTNMKFESVTIRLQKWINHRQKLKNFQNLTSNYARKSGIMIASHPIYSLFNNQQSQPNFNELMWNQIKFYGQNSKIQSNKDQTESKKNHVVSFYYQNKKDSDKFERPNKGYYTPVYKTFGDYARKGKY